MNRNETRISILMPFYHLYPEALTGPSVFCFNLARALAKNGHGIRVVATYEDEGTLDLYSSQHISVVSGIRIKIPKYPLAFFARFAIFISMFANFALHELISPSSAFLCVDSASLTIGYPVSAITGKKCVVEFTGGDVSSLSKKTYSAKQSIEKTLARIGLILAKRTKQLLVLSNQMEELLIDQGVAPSKILKVFHGFDDPYSHTQPKRRSGEIRLVFVGAFSEELYRDKRLGFLLDALVQVRRTYPNAVIELVGDYADAIGEDTKDKLAEAGSSAIMTGRVSHEKVFELLHKADIFVHPSVMEGMSNAIIEAAIAGVPIIASDIPPNREFLSHVGGSILFPLNSKSALRDSMIEMIENLNQRQQLARMSAIKLIPRYSLEAAAANYQSILLGTRLTNDRE
jgi:glycosyltransferase involved in cell wall biosynthesis